MHRLTNWQPHACILVPDDEGVPRGEAGVVVEHRLRWEVGGQVDSGALEVEGHVVGEQLGGLGGEGDGEELTVAVIMATQEFV